MKQLILGEVVNLLNGQDIKDFEVYSFFNYGLFPVYQLSCSRSDYSEPSINCDLNNGPPLKVKELISIIEENDEYCGYKGGYYYFNSDSSVWLSTDYGSCGEALVMIKLDKLNKRVILIGTEDY